MSIKAKLKAKRLSGDFTSSANLLARNFTIVGGGSSSKSSSYSANKPLASFFTSLGSTVSSSSSSSSSSSLASTVASTVGSSTAKKMDTTTPRNQQNVIEMTDMSELRRSVVHSYKMVRFIGSTPLRKRQTYPMLNWILTDLLYQSKCIGSDLSVCITNCLMKEKDQERSEQFQKLKQQLTQSRQEDNGLVVSMDIVLNPESNNDSSPTSPTSSTSSGTSEYWFQICNPSDGQILLRHKFSRIFLLGKYSRQPSLFYYVHKSDDDVTNSVPTIYLFQATNPVQQTEICVKFNELRPKLCASETKKQDNLSGDFIYNPLMDNNQINVSNNCFEVRHIGSVMTSNKRSTPAMIDRVAEKFHREILKDSLERDGTSNQENRPDSASPTIMTEEAITTGTATTELDVKPKVITTTKGGGQRQYRKNRFLVELIEENELDNNDDQQLQQQQQSLGSESGKEFLRKQDIYQQNSTRQLQEQQLPNRTMLFIIGTMDICLISTENHRTVYTKTFANISHCSQGSKHANHFGIIVREPFVPSWFDGSATSSKSRARSVPNQPQPPSTSATTAPTTTTSSTTETYVLHIFQCQADSIVNDLLCSLRQSFNNAFRHKTATATNTAGSRQPNKDGSPSTLIFSSDENIQDSVRSSSRSNIGAHSSNNSLSSYCQNCPMNWFHQLCLDIYGLDDVKVFAILLYRVRHGSSERKWREYYSIFDYLQLESLEQKVDLLIIMLKAKVDKMQRYHEIRDGQCQMDVLSLYEQIEQHDPVLKQYQQQKSTLSLNRLEGLRLMAKSSLSNTFDAFRKRNRYSQSNENIHPYHKSNHSSQQQQSTTGATGFPPASMAKIDGMNNSKAFHRRNTVADCSGEDGLPINPDLESNLQTKFIKSDSVSSYEEQSAQPQQRQQALMDIYIKTSTGNAMSSAQFSSMEELRQNLNQLLDPKILLVDEDETSTDSMSNESEVFSEQCSGETRQLVKNTNNEPTLNKPNQQDQQTAVQMRHRLFRRIRKTLNPYKNDGIEKLINADQDRGDVNRCESNAHLDKEDTSSSSSSTKAKQLWRFAIRKQVLLIKQERQRKRSTGASQAQPTTTTTTTSLLEPKNLVSNHQNIKSDMVKAKEQEKSKNTPPDVRASIMERVAGLYEDLPPIETGSQLEMNLLQWRKLMEMFQAYCHNNPDDPIVAAKIQTQQQSPSSTDRSAEQEPAIHWWSHYERSIVDALKMGVPKEIRSTVWKFLAKYRRFRRGGSMDGQGNPTGSNKHSLYRSLLKQLAIHQHAIFVDLGRTFPTIPYFAEPMGPGQLALYNLLKAYSLFDKQVEYCQGLSFVAGILLLHMNEDDAFDQLVYVLYECGLREQYKPSMDALQMQMYQLNRLLYDLDRPLYDHLDRMDISPTLYAAPSFLTLFASQFSIAFVSRVFDLLMFYGLESIFRVFYYLISRIRNEILAVQSSDFETIMHLMRTRLLSLNTTEMVNLFNQCLQQNDNVQSFSSRLEQYRLEYKILQEEFVHLNQINKLAVEQKLQQQNKPNRSSLADNNRDNSGSRDSSRTRKISGSKQPPQYQNNDENNDDTMKLQTLVNELRSENDSLKKQNNQLRQQNMQLQIQVEELSLQTRRQSH